MKPFLTADKASFAYGRRHALRNVSLAIEAGEFVGVIGANGSGKTTLLRVLLGLLPPATGEVPLGSAAIGSLTRRQIAVPATRVPQEPHVDFAFSSRDIVAMYLLLRHQRADGVW